MFAFVCRAMNSYGLFDRMCELINVFLSQLLDRFWRYYIWESDEFLWLFAACAFWVTGRIMAVSADWKAKFKQSTEWRPTVSFLNYPKQSSEFWKHCGQWCIGQQFWECRGVCRAIYGHATCFKWAEFSGHWVSWYKMALHATHANCRSYSTWNESLDKWITPFAIGI